jgi:hypothetical protein
MTLGAGGPVALGLAVLAIAVVEIWGAVPAGLALGLDPVAVWLMTVLGSVLGVVAVGFAGDGVRRWIVRRRSSATASGRGRLFRLWARYGVVGWGLISPLVFAPAMGTAIGLALGAPTRRLLPWMVAGVLLWTTILVVAGFAGLSVVRAVR